MTESARYGALDIAVTSRFHLKWDDRGSGANMNGSFFSPTFQTADYQAGWRILAHVGRPNFDDLDNQIAVVMARGVNSDDAMLRQPVDFELIWKDQGSGANMDGAVWRMIPPDGYVALGDVFTGSWDKPNPATATYACVRKEIGGRRYVREAEIGSLIWNDQASGANADVSVWQVKAPPYPSDSVERLILDVNAFVAHNRYEKPTRTVWVLDLPAVVIKRNPPEIPVLTGHQAPDPIAQITDRAVTVPCTVVKDPSKTAQWQALNSPFYTLERRVNYTVKMFRDNQNGTLPATDSQSVTTGVTTEQSEEYSRRTSVTVSASAGIELKGFSASVETSVTTELGYSSRYGVTQLQQETKTWSLATPPRSSGALWAATHEVLAIRKDGEAVGGQGGLKFDVDTRVTGEYPGGSGVRTSVDGIEITSDDLKVQPFGEPESNIPEDVHDLIAAH